MHNDDFLNLLEQKGNSNTSSLSSLKMTNEEKGTLLRDISGKCDIGSLIDVSKDEKKHNNIDIHRNVMNVFFDSVINAPKSMPSKPKKIKIDCKDKFLPPSKGWPKSAFKEMSEYIGENKVKKILKENNKTKLEDCLLKHKEYNTLSLNETYKKTKKLSNKTLDPWQKEVIESFTKTKCNSSLLLLGPTSGGKTYVSMGVLRETIDNLTEGIVGFVSPNFYLSLQTYSTILSTFLNVKNSCLLTEGLQEISGIDKPGVKVVVGTPKEMWNLCKSDSKLKFDMLVVDEIHMMGSNDVDKITKTCLSCILSRAKNIFGLSATINPNSVNDLLKHIKDNTGQDAEYIQYTGRPVPLHTHSLEKEITNENTADFLIKLKNENKTPCLVFDINNDLCLEQYKSLISYLENENDTYFKGWKDMIEDVNLLANNYNNNSANIISLFGKAYSINSEKFLDSIGPTVSATKKNRETALNKIIDSLTSIILKNHEPNKYQIRVDKLTRNLKEILKGLGIRKTSISIDAHLVLDYLYRYKNTLANMTSAKNYKSMCPADIEFIDTVPEGSSPYLHVGNTKGAKTLSKILTKVSEKDRSAMLELCRTERCSEKDVKPVFELIASGLKFGVGILTETIPYTVQIKIMQLLQNREIDVIFASQSMRMGINFPIKSCIIRQLGNREMPVDSLMQMAGRAGRRGYDTEGNVYYWNVKNHDKVTLENLEKLNLEPADENKAQYVDNSDVLAQTIHKMIAVESQITQYINKINKIINTNKKNKLPDNSKVSENDMERLEREENSRYAYDEDTSGNWDASDSAKNNARLLSNIKRVIKNNEKGIDIVEDIQCVVIGISNHIGDTELKKQSADLAKILYELIDSEKAKVSNPSDIRKAINTYSLILQELYMKYRLCKARKFLSKLDNIFEILQQIKYRVI